MEIYREKISNTLLNMSLKQNDAFFEHQEEIKQEKSSRLKDILKTWGNTEVVDKRLHEELEIPKRKLKKMSVYEKKVLLTDNLPVQY